MVELMVTISVMVIVLAVATPSMTQLAASNQVAGAKSAFASTIALARTEAARRGQTVMIQAESGGAVGNEFANGWSVYVDSDGSGAVNAGDLLLRKFEAPNYQVRLHGSALVKFQPTGYVVGGATVDYTICRTSGSVNGFKVSVLPSGIADVSAIASC
jgi:type IV fimbrial biogenesis protein FimT